MNKRLITQANVGGQDGFSALAATPRHESKIALCGLGVFKLFDAKDP